MNLTGQLMRADRLVAEIENNCVRPVDPARMPLHLDHGGSFLTWLRSRVIDGDRPNARLLKSMLALGEADDMDAVLSVRAATMTDHYWFKTARETLTWEDVRFKTDHLAAVALSGRLPRGKQKTLGHSTPDLTTPGASEKAWVLERNIWYLYKRGSVNERYSELFSYALGKALGFSMVKYTAARTYVRSRDFTKGVFDFEPVAALVGGDADEEKIHQAIRSLRPGLTRQYLDILYLDALVCNPDRSPYDLGFLRDWQTGEILGMAPNFDNNTALIARGYGSSPTGSDGALIARFLRLYRRMGQKYPLPKALPEAAVRGLANAVLPENRLDRAYVAAFILDRQARLQAGIP